MDVQLRPPRWLCPYTAVHQTAQAWQLWRVQRESYGLQPATFRRAVTALTVDHTVLFEGVELGNDCFILRANVDKETALGNGLWERFL